MRLDKYLSECGLGTRSEIKKIIKADRVEVNDVVICAPDVHVDETMDVVSVDGVRVQYSKFRYYLLHKPAGMVTAVSDKKYPTVMECFSGENTKGCAPVGRLDLDTEGLLLVTNDGALAHHLLSPSHHIPKTYFAILDGECPTENILQFKKGLDIGDEKLTLPAELTVLQDSRQVLLTIYEGRYHQVKRMFDSVGLQVRYLRRESMGALSLDNLTRGMYRQLSALDIQNCFFEKK